MNLPDQVLVVSPLAPVGIVILAAGASTRMGTPKQLLCHRQQSFLTYAVEVAIASVCDPIVVVLGANADQMRSQVAPFLVQVVESQWQEGMSASIRSGIQALAATSETEAAVLMLCDQPFVSAAVIDQLVEVYQQTGRSIVASAYADTLGVPALFGRSRWAELTSLRQAEGAKQVIIRHQQDVAVVPFAEGAIDIDTPQDYAQFQAKLRQLPGSFLS
jgi:molybdenum cofactor cytidylyltransferase